MESTRAGCMAEATGGAAWGLRPSAREPRLWGLPVARLEREPRRAGCISRPDTLTSDARGGGAHRVAAETG